MPPKSEKMLECLFSKLALIIFAYCEHVFRKEITLKASKMKYKKISTVASLLILGVVVLACPPPTLPPGGRWEANANCTFGPNFQTLTPTRERCHCWGHCGYVCTPSDSSTGTGGSNSTSSTTITPTTTRSTTARSTTAKSTTTSTTARTTTTRSTTARSTTTPSTSTSSSNITSSVSTSTTIRSTTTKKPTTTRTTTRRTTTTTSSGSPCPLGGVWFNPQGQRCRCQTLNQQSFYICEATASSASASSTATSTTATTTVPSTSTAASTTGVASG